MNKRQQLEVKVEVLLGMIGLFQMGRTEKLVSPLGFTATQFVILENLSNSEFPQNTVGGLAAHVNISQPTITRAVKSLLDKGYITAKVDTKDKRRTLIAISTKGRKHYAKAVEKITTNRPMGSPYDIWSDEELEKVSEKMDGVYQWLIEHR